MSERLHPDLAEEFAEVQAQADGGDQIAGLLIKRLNTMHENLQPLVERYWADIEREWMEGSGSTVGLATLLDD